MANEGKELKFYGGGYLEIIENGIKLATMRKPNDRYNFVPGEEVMAICEGEGEVLITIFRNETRRIVDTQLPLQLLDGFLTIPDTVNVMRRFYLGTSRYSDMSLITFTSSERFKRYDLTTRELLLNKPQWTAIQMPELRQVFFPSLAWWLSQNNVGASGWLDYLQKTNLVTREELNLWRRTDSETVDWMINEYREPREFQYLVEGKETGLYEGLILLQTEL